MKLAEDFTKMPSLNMMSGDVDASLLRALSLIGREKHWFQSHFPAACIFHKFCQATDILTKCFVSLSGGPIVLKLRSSQIA